MDRKYLKEYIKNEYVTVRELASLLRNEQKGKQHKLHQLYGLPVDSKIVYADSGGLLNLQCLPQDTTLVMPIFPWSEEELKRAICPVRQLQELIESGRIFPIIQNPHYYNGYEHLKFLFDAKAPSYFIRGAFVYASVLGVPAKMVISDKGIPTLKAIDDLMIYCCNNHSSWIKYAKRNEKCWEHRYRKNDIRDSKFYDNLGISLCYRYASVAICIGKDNADSILTTFSPTKASDILLHLHILFDHIMCHGVGSDFVIHPNTPDGRDFNISKKTGITEPHELSIVEDGQIFLPEEKNEYVECLLKEEHFLRKVNLQVITKESMPQIQSQISRQFSAFNQKVEKISKGKKLTQVSVQVTLYLLSIAAMLGEKQAGGIAGVIAGYKVPWLATAVANTIERMYRNRLTSYMFDLNIEKN